MAVGGEAGALTRGLGRGRALLVRSAAVALSGGLVLAAALAAGLVPGAAVAAPEEAGGPYEVPIYHSTESAANGGKRNFLVYVGVGGGPLNPYLLDTGSRAMFSTYGAWWPGHTTMDPAAGRNSITFASGTVYDYDTALTDVAVGPRGGPAVATAPGVRIARITNVGGSSPARSFRAWRSNVRGGEAPFTSDGTYGNFGGGLDGNPRIGTVLAQFPLAPGLKRGFVVMSGGRDAAEGKLVIGLSAEMIARFPRRLPMQATQRRLPPAQGRRVGVRAFRKAQVAGTMIRLARDGVEWRTSVPTVFDTGGGNGTWTYGVEVPRNFVRNGAKEGRARFETEFSLLDGGRALLAFSSGNRPAADVLGFLKRRDRDRRINPGILMFYTYDVLFNLDDGWIGLRPATDLTP